MGESADNTVVSTIDIRYKPTLAPEARALRDSWLKAFSEKAIVGRLYGENGTLIAPGMSPTSWLTKLRILDPRSKDYILSLEELRAIWIKLAKNYSTAASYHANYTLVAKALEKSIDEIETRFITVELASYKEGGVYWNEVTKKASSSKPTKEALQLMARNNTSSSRRELNWYQLQAEFFYNIMMSLETQRRCLKDYAELFSIDGQGRNNF